MDKELLTHLYIDKQLAINKIASQTGASVGKVYNDIKKYGIETRKQLTDAQKKAMSDANKGRPSSRKGIPLSEETKKKISSSHKIQGAGHKKNRVDGYVAIYYPSHPKSDKTGYIMEHQYIMEQHIGRHLNDDEVVHHKNHIRNDNRIENLQLMTFKEHASLHMRERWEQKRSNNNGNQ